MNVMTSDIRICFLGDSLVNGTGDDSALGWAGRLCARARRRGFPITYYNLGVRRETSCEILSRWKDECMRRLPPSCDGRIVISCGVNDTTMEDGRTRVAPELTLAAVRQLCNEAAALPLLMVGPPPVGDDSQNARIATLSTQLERQARDLGRPYIDIFRALMADDRYSQSVREQDGAHPSSRGYELIAEIVSASPLWWFHESR